MPLSPRAWIVCIAVGALCSCERGDSGQPAPGASAPTAVETKHGQPPPASAAIVAPPTLPDEVTGRNVADPAVTIERCKDTGWSFVGCEAKYPRQGRAWVEYKCASEGKANTPSVLCGRLAEYRIRGVGGPVQREAGVAALQQQCDGGHHLSCYRLAGLLRDDDLERARALAKKGCGSPAHSPIGCRTLLPELESQRSYRVKVQTASGTDAVKAGAQCGLWIADLGTGACSGRLRCGDKTLYGADRSTFECTAQGDDLLGGEDMTTKADGDGALTVDTKAATVRFEDDATGPHGAIVLVGELSSG